VAYYTLEADTGFLARLTERGGSGKVPTPEDLRQAEQWADAEVDQLLIGLVGAYNAATVISSFRSSPPPAFAALAYLYGAAWIFDKVATREWQMTKKGQRTTSEHLRELAKRIEGTIRASGYVTLSDGTLYALSGKRRRGIVVENPGVRFYGPDASTTAYGLTSRHNLETLFREANVEAPIL